MNDRIRLDAPADVLLIEDNAGDVRLAREAFDGSRFDNTLHVVSDGAEALEFLTGQGEYGESPRPDLVLLDPDLSRETGAEFLKELEKTSPRLARVPVIVLAGSLAEKDIVRSHEPRANAYMTKPVDPSEFVATVRAFGESQLEPLRLSPAGGSDE